MHISSSKPYGYLLGILGALLGGLVGVLPNILCILTLERLFVLLYTLIPICVYYGYRLFRGPMTRAAIAVMILLSIVYLFVMEYILLVLAVYREYGMPLFAECLKLFFTPDTFTSLLKDMTPSFAFLAFGIGYSWRSITLSMRTGPADERKAEPGEKTDEKPGEKTDIKTDKK